MDDPFDKRWLALPIYERFRLHEIALKSEWTLEALVTAVSYNKGDDLTPLEFDARYSDMFFEGNHERALKAVKHRLQQECGISLSMQQLSQPPQGLMGDHRTWEQADKRARKLILEHIRPSFYERWGPIERPTNVPELLAILEAGCKPFRFLDLPRDLRDQVYGYVVDRNRCIVNEFRFASPRGYCYPHEARLCRPGFIRHMTAVSHQVREESLSVYYASNRFQFTLRPGGDMKILKFWLDIVCYEALKQLRNVSFWTKSYEYNNLGFEIELSYSRDGGLNSELGHCYIKEWDQKRVYEDKMRAYCDMVQRQMKEEGWRGTGVVEFFTRFPETLRCASHFGR